MGIYKIGIKLIKSQRKDNIFYMIIILVSTALIFNMINILNVKGSGFNNIIERTILAMPILIIILLICFLIFYTNNYLSKLKSKDIATQLLSGINVFKLGISLAMQTSILTGVSYILGLIIGLLLVPIFCLTIYGSLQIINVFIPKYVDKMKNKYFNNKIKIIATNNVKIKIIKNKIISFLIFSTSISVIFSMQVVSSFEKFNLYNRITFIINIVLIAFMIIYRGLYDATNEKNTLNSLILIGYKKDE